MNHSVTPGAVTYAEIMQQPELWPITLDIVNRHRSALKRLSRPAVITGAGSSAYAASAIAASWEDAVAIPTTDLLLDPQRFFTRARSLISIARSGDSPESAAVVRLVRKHFPQAHQLAITCNAEGALAHLQGVNAIVLDGRTNDRSLVMTSSFSNVTLAGVCLENAAALQDQVAKISRRVVSQMQELEQRAREISGHGIGRMVALGSGALFSIAREAALKVMEMTAGQCVAIAETYLGLRHGPMSFLRRDSLVLCFLSSDPKRRKYEEDLIAELRRKELGRVVLIASEKMSDASGVHSIPANAPDLPDALRTPFEIVFPQLLAYHLSLRAGLNPDNPSPAAVITRVVQGVEIHDE